MLAMKEGERKDDEDDERVELAWCIFEGQSESKSVC
jgi:hypothetical protein